MRDIRLTPEYDSYMASYCSKHGAVETSLGDVMRLN